MITKYTTPIDVNSSIYFINSATTTENDDGSIHLASSYMFSGATLMMFSNFENPMSTGRTGSIPMMFEGDIARVEVDADFSSNWQPYMRVEAFYEGKRIFEYSKEGKMVEFQTTQNNFQYNVYLYMQVTGGVEEAEGSEGWVDLKSVTVTVFPEGEFVED